MEKNIIDFSRYRQRAEDAIEHTHDPCQHLRPQNEIERHPTFFQRRQEQEGRSNWSGGVWGGRQDHSR
jgi:hypothetical protein